MKLETIEIRGRQVAKLNPEIEAFLESYKPANEVYTNRDEIDAIIHGLDILGNGNQLTALRNAVVLFYSRLREERGIDTMSSMQSVTAVIDQFIYGVYSL